MSNSRRAIFSAASVRIRIGRTVTEIATALGFDHLGRFSGAYKQLYGEPPAQTVRAAD